MRSRFLSRGSHQWLVSILLTALVVRALVPVGFMPSSDRPFTLQICPDGFPAQLLHGSHHHHGASDVPGADEPGNAHSGHHQHAAEAALAAVHDHSLANEPGAQHPGHGSHDHSSVRAEHCVFAAAAGAGPAPQLLPALAQIERQITPAFDSVSALLETQRFRVQQPRAPPALS
jgi:hypothetical protein